MVRLQNSEMQTAFVLIFKYTRHFVPSQQLNNLFIIRLITPKKSRYGTERLFVGITPTNSPFESQ